MTHPARTSFPWRRLFRDALVVAVLCVACALIITAVTGKPGRLLENLVFSTIIGGIAFILIDGARLFIWRGKERTAPLPFFGIVLVAVPAAQFGGTLLASAVLGLKAPPLGGMISGGADGMLLFTLIMTVAGTVFLHNRERLLRAEAQAAEEKARSELVARQALEAQLQLLQAQIEPHMLFNTLANLQGLIAIDPERAQHMLNKLKMPATPSALNEVLTLIAKIGGFVARTGDGEPGVKTIWKGLDQVHASAETLRALREELG